MLVLLALLVACGSSDALPEARGGRSGLQGTGTLDGQQVAVTQGLPELVVGDCDPIDGRDTDVCAITDTIGGRLFVLTIENPDVLVPGERLPVGPGDCASPQACDDVTDVAIVTLKLDTDAPVRATDGSLVVERVEPFANYRGEVDLDLPNGFFSGSFDLIPRPE